MNRAIENWKNRPSAMDYREIPPPSRLAGVVECLWTSHAASVIHRVVPDGCADIIYTQTGSTASLNVVGAMTRFEDFVVTPGQLYIGVRFRPGMWTAQFRLSADQITDEIIALEDVWGARARKLIEMVSNASSCDEAATQLFAAIKGMDRLPVQRAVEWMECQRGSVSLDEAARQAGLSTRHFRRVCLTETGLSPKLLARILKFRYALSRVREESGDHAGLAADCGYADQSHLIAEFRRFAGRTPASYAGRHDKDQKRDQARPTRVLLAPEDTLLAGRP